MTTFKIADLFCGAGGTSTGAVEAVEALGYGNGKARPVTEPLPTVTTRDRFALILASGGDIRFRMLRWPELARAQGFRPTHKFTGTTPEITKQIGNAVPRHLARAMVLASVGQRPDIAELLHEKEAA